MAVARSAHFSAPVLSPPSPKRLLLWPPTILAVSRQLRRPHALLGVTHQVSSFARSLATDGSPEVAAVPRSVPVRVAHELLLAGHRYLDVRTVDEFNAGHVPGATNIPYMFKTGAGMTGNPSFVEEVSSIFGKDDEIIIGCQSGRRSLMAAADLSSAGFTGITDIAGGYSAWMQTGLPSEQ